MTRGLLERRYGFGVAGVCLAPEPQPASPESISLGDVLRETWGEARMRGAGALARTALGATPAVALFAVLLLAFVATLARDAVDEPELRIVRFEPLPAPEPEQIPEPAPPPEPRVALEPVAPPPAAPPRPSVPAPAPAPVVARLETPPPPPRPARPMPRSAKPRIAPPALAPVPVARTSAPPPLRTRPAPSRPPPPVGPPKLGIDPVAERVASVAPPAVRSASQRSAAPAPTRAMPKSLAVAPLAAPPPANLDPAFESSSRTSGRTPAPRSSEPRRSARPSLAPAFAAAPASPAAASNTPIPSRVTRAAAAASSSAPRQQHGKLAGVPLGALAACVSDREEDTLKLAVVGTVGGRAQCTSAAGRYHFVETRNLNAFLMWIERAPSRRPADRCVELRLALECLRGASVGRSG